jgi:hypothetical protein
VSAVPPVNPFIEFRHQPASIVAVVTVTLTVAVSQLVDLVFHRFGIPKSSFQQAPAATTLVPDNVIPALVAETKVVLT